MQDEEAIDLIRTLPEGSLTVSAIDPARSWEKWQHSLADIQDQLFTLFTHVPKGEEPPRVTRPRDLVERKKALESAQEARKRIKDQEWEEV